MKVWEQKTSTARAFRRQVRVCHAQVPLVQKTTTDFEPQTADHEFGLGDTNFQVIVAHAIDERWAFGVGARVSAQTGADSLGSGEWQVMPGLGVRYMLFELGQDSYFVPSMRYAMSIPGNPGARRISEPQIAPTLNIDLPGPFFLTFYPSHDIRINYGAPIAGQTGRLFLPFDALIGRQSAILARGQRANRQRLSRL
jgi:hypothetical protein